MPQALCRPPVKINDGATVSFEEWLLLMQAIESKHAIARLRGSFNRDGSFNRRNDCFKMPNCTKSSLKFLPGFKGFPPQLTIPKYPKLPVSSHEKTPLGTQRSSEHRSPPRIRWKPWQWETRRHPSNVWRQKYSNKYVVNVHCKYCNI